MTMDNPDIPARAHARPIHPISHPLRESRPMSEQPPHESHQVVYEVDPHRGVLILVLGILSLVICALLGPVAWLMGSSDIKAIDSGRMDPSGRGLTMGGMICGIVGTAFLALFLLGFIVWIVFFVLLIGAAAAGA